MTDNSKVVMDRTSRRRLQKDIVELIKYPLTEHGIYYAHDEENMLKGYAVIFGIEPESANRIMSLAIGAATREPAPPCSTTTLIEYFGLLKGAKPVNNAWSL